MSVSTICCKTLPASGHFGFLRYSNSQKYPFSLQTRQKCIHFFVIYDKDTFTWTVKYSFYLKYCLKLIETSWNDELPVLDESNRREVIEQRTTFRKTSAFSDKNSRAYEWRRCAQFLENAAVLKTSWMKLINTKQALKVQPNWNTRLRHLDYKHLYNWGLSAAWSRHNLIELWNNGFWYSELDSSSNVGHLKISIIWFILASVFWLQYIFYCMPTHLEENHSSFV